VRAWLAGLVALPLKQVPLVRRAAVVVVLGLYLLRVVLVLYPPQVLRVWAVLVPQVLQVWGRLVTASLVAVQAALGWAAQRLCWEMLPRALALVLVLTT
jgi:hypothetical protein